MSIASSSSSSSSSSSGSGGGGGGRWSTRVRRELYSTTQLPDPADLPVPRSQVLLASLPVLWLAAAGRPQQQYGRLRIEIIGSESQCSCPPR